MRYCAFRTFHANACFLFSSTSSPFLILSYYSHVPNLDYHTVSGFNLNVDDAVFSFNRLIDRRHPPSHVEIGKLLKALIMEKDYHIVVSLFSQLEFRGIAPSFITLNMLIDCFCQMGHTGYAFSVLGKIIKMDGLFKSRHIEDATALFLKIIGKGIRPSVVTCNILIDGLCKGGRLKTAQQFFRHIHINGYQLDVITYNAMISGLCKEDLLDEAMALLTEMDKNSCFPNIVTYEILIRALLERNENHKAEKLLCEMISKRVMSQ
ncbi:hypothetical protein AHAS_Ahas02G0159100 [Arachis hypogaea]